MRRQFVNKIAHTGKSNLYMVPFLLMAITLIIVPTITCEAVIAPASYVVYKDGTTYYAQNGQTGVNDYSGTDASTVINNALGALTSGRTWKEKVVLKGDFSLTSVIAVPSYTVLDLRVAKLTLANGANQPIIRNANFTATNTNIEIIGGRLEGNSANNTGTTLIEGRTMHAMGISFVEAKEFVIDSVVVNNCKQFGIYITAGTGGEVNVESKALNCVVKNTVKDSANDHGDGYYITYSNMRELLISNCYSINNARSGFMIEDYPKNITIASCHARENNAGGIWITNGYSIRIIGNECRGKSSDGGRGISVDGANYDIAIIGNLVELFGYDGIYLSGAGTGNCTVIGNICKNNSQYVGANAAGIRVASKDNLIMGNRCYDNQGTKTQYSGIQIDVGEDYNTYIGNDLQGNKTTAIQQFANLGTNSIFHSNIGVVTGNSGTATIPSGQTSVTVNHGLVYTPSIKDIHVTPTNNLGNATKFWVSNPTATQFNINVNTNPGATTATFSWHIK